MRRRFGTPEEEDNIDLTPMLDVVFIMLIFFIVTASFIKESGLSVTRPDQNQPPPPEDNEKKNILISVSSTNRVFFNRLPIDVAAARANIERELADNPDASVVVQTEDGATIDVYTRIHDAAKLAGAKNIVLASK